jgi:hypothetical protein
VNGNDPSGNYAEISIDRNKVDIVIPIRYTGYGKNSDNVGRFNAGIKNTWTGTFGDYDVTTSVKELGLLESTARTVQSWFTGTDKQNKIEILHPNAMPVYYAGIGACSSGGGCEGWFPSNSSRGLPLSYIGAHEAGHMLRLGHVQDSNNLMAAVQTDPFNLGKELTGNQITQVLNSFNQGWPATNGGQASGGFVLYPNKPNTNMMQSVYAK